MTKNKKKKLIYITLQEASKLCSYSQDYLSLRARQGKLKSAKFGRNWVTTRRWLDEYIKKAKEYNDTHNGNGHRPKLLKEINDSILIPAIPVEIISETKKIKTIKVPFNLPIEKAAEPKLNFALGLIIILFLAGGIFSEIFFLNNALGNIASFFPQEFYIGFDTANIKANSEIITADLQGKIKEYFKDLFEGAKIQFTNLKSRILSLRDLFNKKSILVGEGKNEGLVVIPSSEENESLKEKIKKSFSDEVKVEIKDESSGIITPIFRKGDGEQYLYIMVPINN